jgi:hypothetical protein
MMQPAEKSKSDDAARPSYWQRISTAIKGAAGDLSGRTAEKKLRVVIANFSAPHSSTVDFRSYWKAFRMPSSPPRLSLFENPHDWGFHIYAPGVLLLDRQLADVAEFWDYSEKRSVSYHSNGFRKVVFSNEEDIAAYLEAYGFPDLFINHGRYGHPILKLMEGKCFRVHVPAMRLGMDREDNYGAECYLVDDERFLDDRSMMYIPVVNTKRICPLNRPKERDFVYLAANYGSKRQDFLLDTVRGTEITGHLHPVDASKLNLSNTRVTTSSWNERDVVELLRTSRIAVYPGCDSNAASMWECVAAGLPIVMSRNVVGGRHLVVPGVTGELATDDEFGGVMRHVLKNLSAYRPRAHFERQWDTVKILEGYFSFFGKMGWPYPHVYGQPASH